MLQSALSGVRVADFGHVLAGPFASMLLGSLGAEVIKIETRARPDEQRVQHGGGTLSNYEASSNFLEVNLNKLSVSLNLTEARGRELAKRVVGLSDVVIENMRPGVMDKLGLGYDELSRVKQDIIMLSLSGFGATGPYRRYSAYNPCFTSFSGLAHLTGYADGPPNTMTSSGGDARAGTAGAFAVLMALNRRQHDGQGQHIDLSSCEVINSMIGDQMMQFAMNGRSPSRSGNHVPTMAPHNCYPCRGEDQWISIAVGSDEEWHNLQQAMGSPAWAAEEAYSTLRGRLAHESELDELIGAWTREFDYIELMHRLQRYGVAATPSYKAEDLFMDAHLTEREALREVEHPVLGTRKLITPPLRMSATPARIVRRAPLLGEDNKYVICDLLGIAPDELAQLEQDRIVY